MTTRTINQIQLVIQLRWRLVRHCMAKAEAQSCPNTYGIYYTAVLISVRGTRANSEKKLMLWAV